MYRRSRRFPLPHHSTVEARLLGYSFFEFFGEMTGGIFSGVFFLQTEKTIVYISNTRLDTLERRYSLMGMLFLFPFSFFFLFFFTKRETWVREIFLSFSLASSSFYSFFFF
jgi:hypothetical protein